MTVACTKNMLSFNTHEKHEPGNSLVVRRRSSGRPTGYGGRLVRGIGCELDDASPAAGAESSPCGCGIGRCGAGGVAGGASVLELLSLPNQTCGLTAAGTCSGNSSAGAGAAGSSLGSSRSAAKNAASGGRDRVAAVSSAMFHNDHAADALKSLPLSNP